MFKTLLSYEFIFHRKHRIKQTITPHMKYLAAADMVRERENLEILSKSYLSPVSPHPSLILFCS